MRIIIICAGDETRWDNYMGVHKHFAVLNGEPILLRTLRLLKERGIPKEDIYVVSKDYQVDAVNVYPKLNKNNFDADKFLSSRSLWNKDGRTVILYGDVYFSDEAMDTILQNQEEYWRIFCRPDKSRITKTPYGECFAVSLYPIDHEYAYKNLKKLIYLYKAEVLDRIGGWEWARVMAGVPVGKIQKHYKDLPVYVVIDDETDDLDYPSDYERLKKLWT